MNKPTKELAAAAHLKNYEFYEPLKEREKNKYVSDTPEFGIDIDAIYNEAIKGRRRYIAGELFLLVVFIGTIMNLEKIFIYDRVFGTTMIGYFNLVIVIALCVICDLSVYYLKRKSAKDLLLNASKENEDNTEKLGEPNVIVSSQFTPFVGSGVSIGGWSVAVNTNKPKNDACEVLSFSVNELYENLNKHVNGLKVANLCISDRLYVDGRDIACIADLMPNKYEKPLSKVGLEVIMKYMGGNESKIRHYRVYSIDVWDGMLIISALVRLSQLGSTLYCEYALRMLAPPSDRFICSTKVNKRLTFRVIVLDTIRSIVVSPFVMLFSPILAISWVWPAISDVYKKVFGDPVLREIKNNVDFNFGRPRSLREIWSGDEYQRYFQMMDKDMYHKILQQAVLDGLVDFLDEHNISTESLKEQNVTIMNEGLFISGGDVNIEALAVGEKASASKMLDVVGVRKQSGKK